MYLYLGGVNPITATLVATRSVGETPFLVIPDVRGGIQPCDWLDDSHDLETHAVLARKCGFPANHRAFNPKPLNPTPLNPKS